MKKMILKKNKIEKLKIFYLMNINQQIQLYENLVIEKIKKVKTQLIY